MKKIKVSSSQYSYFFGNKQIHFPYSIATIASYSLKDELIKDSFEFEKVFLVRDRLEMDIEKAKDSDILLCSCYSWNWEITNKLAKEVKNRNPNCLVIYGGPEVPDLTEDFFSKYPHVDIIVHGEGEIVLYNLLSAFLKNVKVEDLDTNGAETKYRRGAPQDRISELDIIPSPYSTDLIWDLVDRDSGYKYIASWETNRGCPFQCTFCDWGSATKTKLRNFSEEKLFKEIDWFGKNSIVYIDCCDGNFGIFQERDFKIASKLAEVKNQFNFPERLNLTWVKSSSEKIIPIASKLASVGLLRAVSLSMQSFDANTLKIIKRSNIKFDKFETLVKQFDDNGIQSYTELIMGLPGETLQSFKKNWEILASAYPQPTILVWNCSVFVNAPMNDEKYKSLYGIKVFKSPVFMQHSVYDKNETPEFEKMINGTNSLPREDLEKVYLYNWIMMVFNSFGILEFVSRYFNNIGVNYTSFYECLQEYCESNSGAFSEQLKLVKDHAKNGYNGKGWDYLNSELGEISWPLEEASWLKLTRNKESLQKEIVNFLSFLLERINTVVDEALIEDLVKFQLFVLNLFEDRHKEEISETFLYNWVAFFNKERELTKETRKYSKDVSVREADPIKWGYETIWFGRRSQKFKSKLKFIRGN